MPIVTFSRQYGSGGSEIAARVARTLRWRLYDNDVVEQVAARLGISTAEVSAREERVPSLVERMTSAMALGVPEVMPMVGDMMTQPSEERMVEVTRLVLDDAVREVKVVKLSELSNLLPPETNKVTPEQRKLIYRQRESSYAHRYAG